MYKYPLYVMHKFLILLICFGLFSAISVSVEAQAPEFPAGAPIVPRPFTEDPDKFSFAIIGDKTGGGLDKWPIFDRAMAEVNEFDPDFAIMVGDLIQGYTENLDTIEQEWAEFWAHQSRLQIPFLPLPGNHDISNRVMYDYWVNKIGLTYYAFTYKGCLFLLLNTEEKQGGANGWFGETQIAYVIGELEKNKGVRHTFVFMHKPAWLHSDSDWNQIEAVLSGRKYTVFAGHYHNLTLHTRNDYRYFVLGATGAGFTPKQTREFGAFDHYSVVTVDGADVTVALIEPGNVYPANISTAEFKDKLLRLLTYQADFDIDRSQPRSTGTVAVKLKNELEKVTKVEVAFNQTSNWQITPDKISLEIQPGWEAGGNITLSCPSNALTPFPTYRYAIIYGGEQLYGGDVTLHPIKSENLHALKDWMIVGPFELGTTTKPPGDTKDPEASLPNFKAKLGPELDGALDKKYQGKEGEIGWQEYHAQGEAVDLNQAFHEPDWAIGYGVAYIKSPDKRTVFAGIRGDDVTRLFVNGVELYTQWSASSQLTYIDLPLNEGWNTVMVKCADYTGSWSYQLAVENPKDELVFSYTK